MNVSTKGRYAARIMVFMAMQDGVKPISRHAISEAEDISSDYVGQILMKLKTAGLVRSHRGINGGFSLAKVATDITMADVISATEGEIALAPCAQDEFCPRSSACTTRGVWREAEKALRSVFESKNLAQLAEQSRRLESSHSLTFEI